MLFAFSIFGEEETGIGEAVNDLSSGRIIEFVRKNIAEAEGIKGNATACKFYAESFVGFGRND